MGAVPTARARQTAAALALAAAAATGLVGCGGSSTTTTAAGAAPTTVAGSFASCMGSRGIPAGAVAALEQRRAPSTTAATPADPGGGDGSAGAAPPSLPPGVTRAQLHDALRACRGDLPGGRLGHRRSQALAAYRSCMAAHGVTLPSGHLVVPLAPSASTGTPVAPGPPATVAPSALQAAEAACAPLRPAHHPGPATAAGPGAA